MNQDTCCWNQPWNQYKFVESFFYLSPLINCSSFINDYFLKGIEESKSIFSIPRSRWMTKTYYIKILIFAEVLICKTMLNFQWVFNGANVFHAKWCHISTSRNLGYFHVETLSRQNFVARRSCYITPQPNNILLFYPLSHHHPTSPIIDYAYSTHIFSLS